jgi:hypothetical protein
VFAKSRLAYFMKMFKTSQGYVQFQDTSAPAILGE